ncbi:MAG: UDP-N-acetylmuramoyl-L-alanyl-D-glutamate--2,6-diaminopimelate ligase [Gammaproteobacteria bacterium]|nr:UDP-N-acetylmuramoyl-L-alanyl-D-glutamate--2,6-diaminopimelate ligase [Gammaproteobacteria bacterium]MCK5668274.1 UDP-N-acetylmuramoyl-L-alanyl-D-glutamate--2,6-diaminopimelate ligase [Gammaproteobacteria bacterium]
MMSVDTITTPQTLSQLLQGLSNISSQHDVKVTGISSDSRKVKPGDLFFAYNDSGFMNYVKSAIESGASAVVLELEQTPDIPKYSVPVIALPQLRAQAGLIAARFFKNPSHDMNVIGVTGTNGKTTVSYLIAQAFNYERQGKSGLIGTLGCGPFDQLSTGPNTTPEPVALQNTFAELREEGIDVVAMEVSSHGLDQYRVSGVEFDIAVFTNLSRDHLDYHQTMENYAESKRRLFSDYLIKQAVINIDDAFGRELIEEFQHKIELVGYTLKAGGQFDFPVVAGNIVSNDATGLTLEIDSPFGNGTLTSPLMGEFNASNLLASLSALCLSGIAFQDAVSILSICSGAPGRMESFRREGKPLVIVDYSHTPDALKHSLHVLKSRSSGKLVCVFGCGGQRDQGKRAEMGQVAEAIADHIFLTNDNPRNEPAETIIEDIVSGIKDHSRLTKEPDRRTAITLAIHSVSSNDVVLIAGKGHEDYQEIAGVRIPLSDRSIVEEVLDELNNGNNG